MLHELRKVIPSFLRRVDVAERGGRWSTYLATTRQRTAELVDSLFADETPTPADSVTLVDWDPDAEHKLLAAICYPHSNLPEHQLLDKVARLGAAERLALVRAYVGERENRRHKPGRAFERVDYRFDVLSDYGAFRDLQRHRLLTIEWQRADAPPRLRAPRARRRRRPGRRVRRGDAPLGAGSTTPCTTTSPSRRRTPWRWPIACAT